MAPDLERLALTPWPTACWASSGTRLLSSVFARAGCRDSVCGRLGICACERVANWDRTRISLSHGASVAGLGPVGGSSSHRLANYGVTKTLWCYQNMAERSTEKVTPKRPGRPATGRDPVLTVRLPPSTRLAIERWAKRQKDKPSRSEAIRRLIEIGLAGKQKDTYP